MTRPTHLRHSLHMPIFGLLLIALATVASVSGCLPTKSAPEVNLLTATPLPICRIAVLPFVNNTDYVQGGAIVTRIFVAELNRLGGFTVVQEGDVRRILRQMQIAPKESPGYEQRRVLADRLGVDAIVSGEIVAMHEEVNTKETNPLLAVDLKLLAVGSNTPVITTYHSRRGEEYRKLMHFGMVNTMTSLAVMVSDEILEIWFAKGVKPCAS